MSERTPSDLMSADTFSIPSGIPPVDERWGGFLPGHAYVIVGRAADGRYGAALRTVLAAVQADQRSLIISPRDKNDLVADGSQIGLDLPGANASGQLRLLRIPSAAQLASRGVVGLEKAFEDFRKLIRSDRPDRVVVEDFTPLVQFDTFERFRRAFGGLLEEIKSCGASLVVGLGKPGNDASRELLQVVSDMVDGVITLNVADGKRWIHLARRGDAHEVAAGPAPADARPESAGSTLPPEAVAPHAAEAVAAVDEPQRDASAIPLSQIIRPPAPAADLLEPGNDTFGNDPADEIIDQGYIVDSHAGRVMGRIPTAPLPHSAPPLGGSLPSFAPLPGTASPSDPSDPNAAFHAALAKAFADLPYGAPFLVVAVRMEPTNPDSEHFETVANGLRGSLRPEDHILVDSVRRRAAVLLPGAGGDAVQPLYAGLQQHLRHVLGEQADAVLRAVGAVSVPNGQPFTSPKDLLAYAIDS